MIYSSKKSAPIKDIANNAALTGGRSNRIYAHIFELLYFTRYFRDCLVIAPVRIDLIKGSQYLYTTRASVAINPIARIGSKNMGMSLLPCSNFRMIEIIMFSCSKYKG